MTVLADAPSVLPTRKYITLAGLFALFDLYGEQAVIDLWMAVMPEQFATAAIAGLIGGIVKWGVPLAAAYMVRDANNVPVQP
jgi:hypothetical protein